MNTHFERAFNELIGVEGGYSNNKKDSGGATRYGITERLARHYGYKGSMKELPFVVAKEIYQAEFWDALNLTTVAMLSYKIAYELFDTGVNCGTDRAAEFLQQCLNVFNREQQDYEDILVDGKLGSKTLEALGHFLSFRKKDGELVLLRALNCLQGARYIELAEAREKDETFVYGWILKRVVV